MEYDVIAFVHHPDRAYVIEELHLRRMPPITTPAMMVQVLRIVGGSERSAEIVHVGQLPFVPTWKRCSERHCEAMAADGSIILWERHSEATTATILLPGPLSDPFAADALGEAMTSWLHGAPGAVMRATRIIVVADDATAEALLPRADFDQQELLSAHIASGARVWSDFKVHDDGYGRLLVAANGMAPGDLGRMVQRFQELGNYRNLALMGLRVAQQRMGQLATLENELMAIMAAIQADEPAADLLDRLVRLAGEATAIDAESGFRLSATAAYTDIALQRLHALAARPIAGFQSLDDFIERRLLPAAKTCAAFDRRLERLAQRVERATAQLRTSVDLAIQHQNSAMLASMERSSTQQLHLQRVVEGLSVVAVSYYCVGLFGYFAKGMGHIWPVFDSNVTTAVMALPIIVIVAIYLRLRARL